MLIAACYGENYQGIKHRFTDWYADQMFEGLYETSLHSAQDFSGEITLNRNAILLNFQYWVEKDFSQSVLYDGEQKRFLEYLAEFWRDKFPDLPLLGRALL